ncbi:MAG: DJ-1/PfpI family protein [Acidimicrobiia bacterium]|nr:DJ-1/PfpI family protein [Acidimicrobiia bacterium]
MATSIGIFIFDGAEELDFAGPWEVLAAWAMAHPDDDVSVFTVAPEEGPIRAAKGLQVIPDYSWATAPPIDVLVYPGGRGTRGHLGSPDVAEWLRGVASRAGLVTSVCTGSLVLADVGLLDGRPATTHWQSLDLLRDLGDDIDVRADARFVDDGDVITAAGVSAGIDMALHLIARLHSPERAREVRRYIQYDPQPPV